MCVCSGGGGRGREETERGAADVGVCRGGGGNGREETGVADLGVCCRGGGTGREVGEQERTPIRPPLPAQRPAENCLSHNG